jgi:simple sugar transport system permease protein
VDILFLVFQQTMFFSIPLLIVALGAVFTERSGVTNIALEGMMIMGAFTSIFFINQMEDTMSGQGLLILAILIATATGTVFSLLHAYAAVNLKADQIISGTALNMFAPAFAIFTARMIQENGVQQINFINTFRIPSVPVLGDIPVIGGLFFRNAYITTYIGFVILIVSVIVLYKTKFGLRLRLAANILTPPIPSVSTFTGCVTPAS